MYALNLPRHLYGHVARRVLSDGQESGWEPAIWFGMLLEPTEVPLLTVLLECGAVYRRVPPHAWRFGGGSDAQPNAGDDPWEWTLAHASRYHAFGRDAAVIAYTTLQDQRVEVIPEAWVGRYQFTLEFFGDAYSQEPTQSKALHAIALDASGRLTFQPGHHVLFHDPSFTRAARMPPTWLRRAWQTWAIDEPEE